MAAVQRRPRLDNAFGINDAHGVVAYRTDFSTLLLFLTRRRGARRWLFIGVVSDRRCRRGDYGRC
jgi:hypothetical protein